MNQVPRCEVEVVVVVRRYDELVDVRMGPDAGEPEAFLWRSRLYVVRAVLGRWRERRSWWQDAAALAVHGQGDLPAGEHAGAGGTGGEHQVWRVEASAGRTRGTGVYDLCLAATAAPQASTACWRMLRVVD